MGKIFHSFVDLYILRHGKAEKNSPGGDGQRRLTQKGRDEIRTIASWLQKSGHQFEIIATSPLARAQETAEIVAETLSLKDRLMIWEELSPGTTLSSILARLIRHHGVSSLLIVGHEPILSMLIGRVISGNGDACINLGKGGMARIRDIDTNGQIRGELHWLLTARQICSLR